MCKIDRICLKNLNKCIVNTIKKEETNKKEKSSNIILKKEIIFAIILGISTENGFQQKKGEEREMDIRVSVQENN